MNGTKHPAQSSDESPIHWPKGVTPISTDGLGHMGVGDDGKLYWDGLPVEVDKRITFSTLQIIFGVISLAAGIVAAGSAAVSAYADLHAISKDAEKKYNRELGEPLGEAQRKPAP